jgi:CRISPR-associated protein Cmr2
MNYFHFTIGPVQSVVAQARRTRDFWGGSFLISYLAGVAIKATEAQGGTIIFPKPDAQFMESIESGKDGPRQGNIPNRFMAEVPEGFDGAAIAQATQDAWQAIGELVWSKDMPAQLQTPDRKALFDRQMRSLWEISWAMGPDRATINLLDRRKNWRTHLAADEPGLKCMAISGLQELSGAERPGKEVEAFWKTLRGSKKDFELDIREGERLSAPAFVKRRFIRHFEQLRFEVAGKALCGWALSPNVPSVSLLAAAPWLAKVAKEDPQEAANLAKASKKLRDKGAALTRLKCLKDAPNNLCDLDGMTLFAEFLENRKQFDPQEVKPLKEALGKLSKSCGSPSPFYAVLLMDGDNLGQNMADTTKQESISKNLLDFARKVEEIVNDHSGFLIYAGGDDVLAVLPLEEALKCAAKLRADYNDRFKAIGVPTTLSGAIVYAHVKSPLGAVLRDAHPLLDDVAKEGAGRDAIAVQIVKPGGEQMTWAQPWDVAIENDQVVLEKIQNDLNEAAYSSGYFYRMRELFELLAPPKDKEELFDRSAMEALMKAEYLASNPSAKDADQVIAPLLKQCRPMKRDEHGKPKECGFYRADAALIVRFLAQKGVA